MRIHVLTMFALAMFAAGCTDTDAEGADTDDSVETGDGDGEIVCRDDGCFQACVREYSPPGAAGELCIEPAADHESWACDADPICDDLTLEHDAAPDLEAVQCVLEALRDRTPGALHLQSGTGAFATQLDVFILSSGVALVDAEGPSLPSTCLTSQIASSVGGLELLAEDDPFWQGCLDATDTEDVSNCLFGATSEDADLVQGLMPWQSPTCASSEASCEG